MPSPHETAYPRLKHTISQRELDETYTPTSEDMAFAETLTRSDTSRLGLMILLKTFQHLGYFVLLRDVPSSIVDHIARCLGYLFVPDKLLTYDDSGSRQSHVQQLRQHFSIKPFADGGERVITQALRDTAQTREDLRDLINVAIETLTLHRYELPGFTTLERLARQIRKQVNETLFQKVATVLSSENLVRFDDFLTQPSEQQGTTSWHRLKQDAGKASLTHFKEHITHHEWLVSLQPKQDTSQLLPDAKLRQFAAEAHSLDAARMRDLEPNKRMTLIAALLHCQAARVLDDLGTLFIKRMSAVHRSAKDALARYHQDHQSRTDTLLKTFQDMLQAYLLEGTAQEKVAAIDQIIGSQSDHLLEQCREHEAYANNNYLPFLWRYFSSHRATFFRLCRILPIKATSHDTSLQQALEVLLEHERSKGAWLDLSSREHRLDLTWLSDPWWRLVTGYARRDLYPQQLQRRQFEVCVFTRLMWDLKSGDVCIEGSLEYADYRSQLVNDETYHQMIDAFAVEVNHTTDPTAFTEQLQTWLETVARETDEAIPGNDSVSIEGGQPVLKKQKRQPEPALLKWLEKQVKTRLKQLPILDVLVDTEKLLNWTRYFGPLSGHDAKLDHAVQRYLTSVFCYGCNLGPSQTARSLVGADRKEIYWVNARHVTEETLERAKILLINEYNRFALPKLWGSGDSASADGTKWDVYEQNLLAEYHVRYGGYGGIGYYHISDTYIALFSRFIPCGVYEAVYILDGLLENESDIQPDIVHSDTHGQSAAVFGLAYLLGIELMPRIRDWKNLVFVRPKPSSRYQHIDELFTDTVDWGLIRRYLPDMFRVALSIKAGKISALTILKRLNAYSRKNQVYLAFRELGKVVRTGFLLRYIASAELRSTIQAAMNKSEQFNAFVKWVSFGGDRLETNDRDLQSKIVQYQHLVANCLIYFTVSELTRIVKDLKQEGFDVPQDALAHINPYLTEHINRFGDYRINLDRTPARPDYDFKV